LNVFYRDVRWFYDSALLLIFYMTPVIYPVTVIPERFRIILTANPLTWMLDLFRVPICEGRVPRAIDIAVGLSIGAGVLVVGWIVFHRYEDEFINYV
jgi:ABC-type polysaccharide/polyol phosphate export permease